MAFFIPSVHKVEEGRYQVVLNTTQTINVTVTESPDVFKEWVGAFHPEHQSFFPVGVAVHHEARPTAQVMTLSIGQECLVFQLFLGSNVLSRDVTVFLRDVCTCYGWGTDAYGALLMAKNPRLSLGRLSDIKANVPNGPTMGLGDFSMMVFGVPVPEPTVTTWTNRRLFKKNQIRETVMEAYISQMIGVMYPGTVPPNDSIARVISSTYPNIEQATTMADRMVYQVSISADQRLRVTYTKHESVLIAWLSALRRRGDEVGLVSIDLSHDHRGTQTAMALAFENSCLVYNLSNSGHGSLASRQVFGIFLGSRCPFVGWNTRGHGNAFEPLGLEPERVFDVKDEFPVTHSYEDLARLVLGYEMRKRGIVGRPPTEHEVIDVAVQAYACLLGGIRFGYENREW